MRRLRLLGVPPSRHRREVPGVVRGPRGRSPGRTVHGRDRAAELQEEPAGQGGLLGGGGGLHRLHALRHTVEHFQPCVNEFL